MPPPNFLIFMTDQQRGVTVLPGQPYRAKTPRLDALRADSVTFSNAHCPSPHCCPSRASFFTGLYPSEHGVWNNINTPESFSRGLRPGVRPWSLDLQEAGYSLRFSGKWHVSNDALPGDLGWEELVVTGGNKSFKNIPREERDRITRENSLKFIAERCVDPQPSERAPGEIKRPGWPAYHHYGIDEDPFGDRAVVDATVASIRQHADASSPWFHYCGPLGPHDPYRVPQRFLDLYAGEEIRLPASFHDPMDDKPALYRRTRDRFDQLTEDEHREAIRHYLAFCSYEDYLFGLVVDALEESGELDNTVLVFMSDHGDYLGEHGLWTKGLPSFESAYHVPLVIRPPRSMEAARGTTCHAMVSLTDFGPTFCELAGVRPGAEFSGASLLPLLRGESPEDWRDALYFQTNGNELYGIQRTIRTGRWKLVFNGFDYDELYDLEVDPDEMVNLLNPATSGRGRETGKSPLPGIPSEHRETVRELYRRLWDFSINHEDRLTGSYITTALASYGPGLALERPPPA